LASRNQTILVVPLIVLLALVIPHREGFTDDGYIHIQYARNIATRGEYAFNPGEVSFGTTSPLWVMIHAAVGRVAGTGEILITTSRVLSWSAGFAAVAAMFVLARALGLGFAAAFCASLLLGAHAWFVRWTALGMEASAAVLAIIGVGAASIGAIHDRKQALLLGFFMAVAALLRPEAYLLVPVYALSVLTRGRRNDWGCVVRVALVWLLLVGPWLLFARYHIGSFLPNTAGAKSGGLVLDPATFIRKLDPIVKIVGSSDGIAALLIVLSVAVARRKALVFTDRARLLSLWAVALPLAYVFFDIQVLSRYMLLTTPFTIVLGLGGLEGLLLRGGVGNRRETERAEAAPGPLKKALAAATAAAVVVNVVFYFAVVLPPSAAFSHDLSRNLKGLALYLKGHSEKGAVVAAADIGYLAYYSERRVLDLGGLVDNETLALREAHTYEEIVDKGLYLDLPKYPRVDFFIDRELSANRFDGRVLAGYRFDSVYVTEVRNLGIRKPGPYFYTLYRLTRESADGA
jgi:arabinofuranosyltransferase